MSLVAQNWLRLQEIVSEETKGGGRSPQSVAIMAVTKFRSVDEIQSLLDAGCCLCGENRLQEAKEKWTQLSRNSLSLHLIGHLQSNKVKAALSCFDAIDSIDSLSTLVKLENQAAALQKRLSVLLEVNCSGEESKDGFRSEEELWKALEAAEGFKWIKVEGFMTMAALGSNEKQARGAFSRLRRVAEESRKRSSLPLPHLSMGMSGDFLWAIKEGSTMIRVGSALFEGEIK